MKTHYRFMSPARQRGNTLTGIIIGLVIGLVIAVIVALLITKGATPFTDKSGKLGKMGEPSIGQASDPNKPLYGNKEAAREANKQFASRAAPAAPAPAAEADPLGEAIASMAPEQANPAPAAAPAPAPAAAEAGEDRIIYYLQAGAFREMADAENTRAKLALLGFEAAITDRTNDSGVLHRVRVGPYNQVEAMNKARAKLLDAGVDVAIVRNQNK
jgi:cell division protein FtsN